MDAGRRRVTTTLAMLATVFMLLTFDDPVDRRFPQVLVLGPDGSDWAAGAVALAGVAGLGRRRARRPRHGGVA